MARIRFMGDSPTCGWFGIAFTNGEWVDASSLTPDQLAMVAANRTFQVDTTSTRKAPPARPLAPPAPPPHLDI